MYSRRLEFFDALGCKSYFWSRASTASGMAQRQPNDVGCDLGCEILAKDFVCVSKKVKDSVAPLDWLAT